MNIYQVDAFTNGPFTGNPAAVIPLDKWLDDQVLQWIAMENNLSETAFFVPNSDGYHLRWFTPTDEVQLCGHATFASAYVIFNKLAHMGDQIKFSTLSGDLFVIKVDDNRMSMDLPTDQLVTVEVGDEILDAVGADPTKILEGREDYVLVFEKEEEVQGLNPDFSRLKTSGVRGIIATAPSTEYDFISRCFYPGVGIDEDPGTGSAHTSLAPYWYSRLGKKNMKAKQISARGSYFDIYLNGDRTILSGQARLFMEGQLFI